MDKEELKKTLSNLERIKIGNTYYYVLDKENITIDTLCKKASREPYEEYYSECGFLYKRLKNGKIIKIIYSKDKDVIKEYFE